VPSLLPLFTLLVPAAIGLAEAEVASALRGDVPMRVETFQRPDGRPAGRGVGAIVVDRPIAEVWATISHYEDKAEYQPRVVSVTVLDKKPGSLRVRMEIDASVTTARYTGLYTLDEAQHTITWTIDQSAPDNTVADVAGDYHLYEVSPQSTLVVYRTFVDPGTRVPRFIQNFITRRSLPNLLRATKQRIESGGRFRK
jgi:uncharacterized membrane protein